MSGRVLPFPPRQGERAIEIANQLLDHLRAEHGDTEPEILLTALTVVLIVGSKCEGMTLDGLIECVRSTWPGANPRPR